MFSYISFTSLVLCIPLVMGMGLVESELNNSHKKKWYYPRVIRLVCGILMIIVSLIAIWGEAVTTSSHTFCSIEDKTCSIKAP
jgi:hypothetical protein